MDITFEEVAHVIQDARYQQAILDTDVPKPDRPILKPPRGFDRDAYVQSEGLGLEKLLREPLGRFFLSLKTEVGSYEANMLRFAEAFYELRRADAGMVAALTDVEMICEQFGVPVPAGEVGLANNVSVDVSDDSWGAGANEFDGKAMTASYNSGGGSTVQITVDDAPPSPGASATPLPSPRTGVGVLSPQSPTGIMQNAKMRFTRPAPTSNNAASTTAVSLADEQDVTGNIGGGGDVEPTSRVTNETNVTRFADGGTSVNVVPTFEKTAQNTHASTLAAATAQAVSRKQANLAHHSPRSIAVNRGLDELLKKALGGMFAELVQDKKLWGTYVDTRWFAAQSVGEKQIRLHRPLGVGAFGTVHGCVVVNIGSMLAMKSMNKKRVKAKRARNQVTAEREALAALARHPSPYAMRLRYAYVSKDAYNFILPLAIGGDLKYHLQTAGKGFSHTRARVYAAEVALGIGHLHSLGLINRDVKPRNILLNSAGRCQISDFGLAVAVHEGKTVKGRAGTDGYWSPEVINNHAYSFDCDWWSYGVCVFEFIAGFSPFSTKHTGLHTRNDGTRKGEIRFPDGFDETAKPLVLALLSKSVADRVGCGGGGVNEIFDPKFEYFRSVDLPAVRRADHPAPWTPERGHIYALPQGEIHENDAEKIDKIKLMPEDEVPFPDFVAWEDHQRDIVKILAVRRKSASRVSVVAGLTDGSGQRDNPNGSMGDGGCCVVV